MKQSNDIAQKKIIALQKKVAKQTESLKLQMQSICENLDYHNSSRFSYNIDKLEIFNVEIQEFKVISYPFNYYSLPPIN